MRNGYRIEVRRTDGGRDGTHDVRMSTSTVVVVGFGMFIAWMSVLTWFPQSVFVSATDLAIPVHGVQAALFLSMACTSMVVLPFSSFFLSETGSKVLHVLGFAICVVSCALLFCMNRMWMEGDDALVLGAWIGWGIACGVLLVLWHNRLAVFKRKDLLFSTGAAFAVGGIAFVIIAIMEQPFARICGFLLPLASFASLAFSSKDAAIEMAVKRSDDRPPRIANPAAFFDIAFSAICNTVMGFVSSVASSSYFSAQTPLFCGVAISLAGLLACTILFTARQNIAPYAARLILPYLAVCLVVMGVALPVVGGWAAVVAVIAFGFVDIINTSNASKNSRYGFRSSIYMLSLDACTGKWGYALGWLGGMGALAYAEATASLAAPCLIALGVMVVGVSTCNFLGIDRRKFIAHDELGRKVTKRGAPQGMSPEQARASMPAETGNTEGRMESVEDHAEGPWSSAASRNEAAGQGDALQRKASFVSSQFGLSRREIDVLVYLVRGRNAAHIAKNLYVSSNTVRSHISRIYAKTGVHSQQELIDLIEGIEE